MEIHPKGPHAARIRQRKYALLQTLKTLPADGLPGSLTLTHRRCGKPTCHCATGAGHPMWFLTTSFRGHRRVERIPAAWVDEIRRRVAEGRAFQAAVAEVLAMNVELLVLWRRQQGR